MEHSRCLLPPDYQRRNKQRLGMGVENNSNDEGTESGPGQDLTQQMIKRILGELSLTKYACESLALIPSGTTNFVFRGTLKNSPAIESLDGNTE